jgi:hypothetical protein
MDDSGSGRLGAVAPFAIGGVVAENRYRAATFAEDFHDLETKTTETTDDDWLHGRRV